MTTIMKRMLTALLALLMLTAVVFGTVACAEQSEDNTDASTTTAASESAEETSSAYSTLEKKKYNREFAILTREDLIDDMYIEKVTGDTLDDLIFDRNVAVAEDYGITFEYYQKDDLHDLNSTLMTQATSGIDDYDMYIGHKFSFASNAQQNHCYNLNKIESLRLSKAWWDQACYENLTIDGKTFLMTGDINPSSMRISACMVVNKDMMSDLQKDMTALNALTKNGEWTLDKLYEYTIDVIADISGDGAISYEDDRFGLTAWSMDVPFSLYYGAGSNFVNIVNGQPELAENSTERVTDIYSMIYKIVVTNQAYYIPQTNGDKYGTHYDVFRDGRSLFCDLTLGKINTFIAEIGMEDEYGILPMPKYDTQQKEYLSFVNGASAFVMVSMAEKDVEFVGTIMEAMAAYNYDHVTPKMFQVVTKLHAAQDPESAAMVDYIVRNRIYDLAYFFSFDISNVVLNNLESKNETITAALQKATKNAERQALPRLIAAYEKCDIS